MMAFTKYDKCIILTSSIQSRIIYNMSQDNLYNKQKIYIKLS